MPRQRRALGQHTGDTTMAKSQPILRDSIIPPGLRQHANATRQLVKETNETRQLVDETRQLVDETRQRAEETNKTRQRANACECSRMSLCLVNRSHEDGSAHKLETRKHTAADMHAHKPETCTLRNAWRNARQDGHRGLH
eukprot:1156063-Pelagomonas_calceolata.AAC.10